MGGGGGGGGGQGVGWIFMVHPHRFAKEMGCLCTESEVLEWKHTEVVREW